MQAVAVSILVGPDRFPLRTEHVQVELDEFKVRCGRGVRLSSQFPLEPAMRSVFKRQD